MKIPKPSHIVLTCILTIAEMPLLSGHAIADETQNLKNQVKALQGKVDSLQKQLAHQSSSAAQPAAGAINFFDTWDPWQQMNMMQRQMGQMMRENMVDFNPSEDIKQTPHEYVVSMDIPGMDKSDINVEVKNGMLIVSGDRNSEVKEQGPNQFYRHERSFGHFYRTMVLPDDVKLDTIDAQYNNGVLTVKIPRTKINKAPQASQKIKVK